MSKGGQNTEQRRNIPENFNRLSMAHERYKRQTDTGQTDDRWTGEREREFKNYKSSAELPILEGIASLDLIYGTIRAWSKISFLKINTQLFQ